MKITSVIASLLLASIASAFVPVQRPQTFVRPLHMSDEEQGGALVPVKEETIEFTAGILGGAAGFSVGGPVLGAIGAAAANYFSKGEGDATEVIQALSKTSIDIFNYLANVDKKYEILSKAKASLEKALDNLKSQGTPENAEAIDKVENALASTKSKIEELNDEYDLVGGGMTALGVVGDLVEKAVKKAGELNEEYMLTDKAKTALSGAVEKAKDAAKEAETA